MASITEEFSGECFCLSESRLGGIVLKHEQKEAVANLMGGKDVLVVLQTAFGKSLIYESFVLAKEMEESSAGCSSARPSCLVIVPLRSIIEKQIYSNKFDLEKKGFSFPKMSWRR